MDRLARRIPWRKVRASRFGVAAGGLTLAQALPGPRVPVWRNCQHQQYRPGHAKRPANAGLTCPSSAGDGEPGDSLLIILGRNDLAAPVKTVRADVVAQMRLAGRGLRCQRRGRQKIVRAVVPSAGNRLLVLLDSHWNTREEV
jgi:hypothetical protein